MLPSGAMGFGTKSNKLQHSYYKMGNTLSTPQLLVIGLALTAAAAAVYFIFMAPASPLTTGLGGLAGGAGDVLHQAAATAAVITKHADATAEDTKVLRQDLQDLATPCSATDAFKDPSDPTACFQCPNADRTAEPINSSKGCLGDCNRRYGKLSFQEALSGDCYSCPDGYKRSVFGISDGKACERGCPAGTFSDLEQCWSCPSGYKRSGGAVTAPDACYKAGPPPSFNDPFPADLHAPAVKHGSIWSHAKANGSMWSRPVKVGKTTSHRTQKKI